MTTFMITSGMTDYDDGITPDEIANTKTLDPGEPDDGFSIYTGFKWQVIPAGPE